MSRRIVIPLAVLLTAGLLLSGCATGNLPRDSAFFPYKRTDNLHAIVSKTVANVVLGCIYVTVYATALAAQGLVMYVQAGGRPCN